MPAQKKKTIEEFIIFLLKRVGYTLLCIKGIAQRPLKKVNVFRDELVFFVLLHFVQRCNICF